ncbi:MAG: hypothetical protein NC095_12110 [Muribaculum sp.]|nr:hypothetical protein [Muribaculum sp.]
MFQQIIDRLSTLATFDVDKSMTDDDFIANIDAINVLCNLCEDLDLDHSDILRNLSTLYPEIARRIHGKPDIQLAMPLIKALYRYIYGRDEDHGPKTWRDAFEDMCCKVVEAYRRKPLADPTDYLFALATASRVQKDFDKSIVEEYRQSIAALLHNIDNIPLAEKIRRVSAYEHYKLHYTSRNFDQWAIACDTLCHEDPAQLDDESIILWSEITDKTPLKELKKRAAHSMQMQVEYLQALIRHQWQSRQCIYCTSTK